MRHPQILNQKKTDFGHIYFHVNFCSAGPLYAFLVYTEVISCSLSYILCWLHPANCIIAVCCFQPPEFISLLSPLLSQIAFFSFLSPSLPYLRPILPIYFNIHSFDLKAQLPFSDQSKFLKNNWCNLPPNFCTFSLKHFWNL